MYEREQSTIRVWGRHLAASSFTREGRKTASENYAIYFEPVFCDLTPLFIKLLVTFGRSFSASFSCVRMQGTFLFATV
jgi:hypothetical protein